MVVEYSRLSILRKRRLGNVAWNCACFLSRCKEGHQGLWDLKIKEITLHTTYTSIDHCRAFPAEHRQRAPPHTRTRQVSPQPPITAISPQPLSRHSTAFLAAGRRPAASLSRPPHTSCPALAPALALDVQAACSSSGLNWLLRLAQHLPLSSPSPPAPTTLSRHGCAS